MALIPNAMQNTRDDRVLVLKPMDDKAPLSSTGMVDTRLFSGENNIHAIKDPQTCLWSLKYDVGALPPSLRGQRFTSFNALKKTCEEYFSKRNVQIKEVIG